MTESSIEVSVKTVTTSIPKMILETGATVPLLLAWDQRNAPQ